MNTSDKNKFIYFCAPNLEVACYLRLKFLSSHHLSNTWHSSMKTPLTRAVNSFEDIKLFPSSELNIDSGWQNTTLKFPLTISFMEQLHCSLHWLHLTKPFISILQAGMHLKPIKNQMKVVLSKFWDCNQLPPQKFNFAQ